MSHNRSNHLANTFIYFSTLRVLEENLAFIEIEKKLFKFVVAISVRNPLPPWKVFFC